MDKNATLSSSTSPEKGTNQTTVGWVSSGRDRGTVDILWSCGVTIFLCVWVSTFPNAPSRNDKWYHRLIDKANLACIGFVGPDLLLGIALGQLASAQRSVKAFQDIPLSRRQGCEWSLKHAFFADMGGYVLESSDFPQGFPVNAEQIFYLVHQGHLDFPNLSMADLDARNKLDTLSKIITIWQVFWFIFTEVERVAHHYPMTTLELTALSFSVVMIFTSFVWWNKPSITQSISISPKDDRSVADIRASARETTHPDLPQQYHRTPLDFLTRRKFHMDDHWQYYAELSHKIRLPLLNRHIVAKPWDRFPSDIWVPAEGWALLIGPGVGIPFAFSFAIAWRFHFPSTVESYLWRACSVYHAAYTVFCTFYYGFGWPKGAEADATSSRHRRFIIWRLFRKKKPPDLRRVRRAIPLPLNESFWNEALQSREPINHLSTSGSTSGWRLREYMPSISERLQSWRNISPDKDPSLEVSLRRMLPIFVPTFLYVMCRLVFYTEDLIGLRKQPPGVYRTVREFLPFV